MIRNGGGSTALLSRAQPRAQPELDRSVPVLLMKVGHYPLHHGSVGAARSLGRVGVRVFAVTEDRFTPTACSRYVDTAFVWRTTGREHPAELISGLLSLGERIGTCSVLITTDDEAAMLVAEHAGVLADRFLLSPIAPDLPRRLNSKLHLAELCDAAGVASPVTRRPRSVDELFEAAHTIGFPVVVKNDAAWERITHTAVPWTTVVRDVAELTRLSSGWHASMPGVVVQEYLPHEETTDWCVAVHCGRDENGVLALPGMKLRSFPAYAGVTAVGLSHANEELCEQTTAFCEAVGFRGIGSLDWRLDRRDGRYKLLDFNVRLGAMFRMFLTVDGIDVVQAAHLDLTGRQVPRAPVVHERRYVVGNLVLASALDYGRARTIPRAARAGGLERAWLASDDPLPGLLTTLRTAPTLRALAREVLRGRWAMKR